MGNYYAKPDDADKKLGEGVWGEVFYVAKDNMIVKRSKLLDKHVLAPTNASLFWKELGIMKRIMSEFDDSERIHFSGFLGYKIYENKSNTKVFGSDWMSEQHKLDAANLSKSKWTCDIYMDHKGTRITKEMISSASPMARSMAVAKALRIVQILHKYGIVHSDLHFGNFLTHNGVLALVDYGACVMEDEPPYSFMVHHRHDLHQLICMMSNFEGLFDIIDEQGKSSDILSQDRLFDFVAAQMALDDVQFITGLAKCVIPEWNFDLTQREKSPRMDMMYSIWDVLTRLRCPEIYKRFLDIDVLPEPHLPLESIYYVYEHYHDSFDSLIAHFSSRVY